MRPYINHKPFESNTPKKLFNFFKNEEDYLFSRYLIEEIDIDQLIDLMNYKSQITKMLQNGGFGKQSSETAEIITHNKACVRTEHGKALIHSTGIKHDKFHSDKK